MLGTITNNRPYFTFIDLFAGVGGFRLGLEPRGGRCVFSCEIDKYAARTYKAWHGDDPTGDIKKLDPFQIPDHDILTGGFPCKSFSIAGVSQRIAACQPHGFDDADTGNLFFDIVRVIRAKKPPVVFLENVKNLKTHDNGRTFSIIKEQLQYQGYKVFDKILDARFWVPQHRERIMIVGLRTKVFGDDVEFTFPNPMQRHPDLMPKLKTILETKPDPKYTLSDKLWKWHQKRKQENIDNGKGFGYSFGNPEGATRTLSARYGKDGSEILIQQKDKNPRKLTPREAARLMDSLMINPSLCPTLKPTNNLEMQ